jgi:hypothetical protein
VVPEVRRRIQAKLKAYRAFAKVHAFRGCRLVHYVSGRCNSTDVPAAEVEDQIEGCLAEGFHIDWAVHGPRLYLRVYEGGPEWEPDWDDVFAERDIPIFAQDGRPDGAEEP